ncbi:MAG TPA: biotin--[acetyl-CoA-carboxylase] ligase [Bacteroidales bacterium]|nr:biotin--[acetyl-CoA-carboxylase] ligase [Bacteroidales bacterium]
MKIIHKDTLESTNAYAEEEILKGHINGPCCIVANAQSSGKGRGTNKWESETGKNLTFSVVCFPDFLTAEKQFYLNKTIALSVFELVSELVSGKNVSIKWPNDIYIGDQKVAGMLIQTAVQGKLMKHALIGIGININQKEFSKDLPNPTSVILHTQSETGLDQALKCYLDIFENYYKMLEGGLIKEIDSKYLEALYRFGLRSAFEYEGKKFHACICDVNEYGWLQLVTDDGILICGDMDKVKMMIED